VRRDLYAVISLEKEQVCGLLPWRRQEGFVMHERWKLFAPEDLRAIIDISGKRIVAP